jgi:hypothetical protein
MSTSKRAPSIQAAMESVPRKSRPDCPQTAQSQGTLNSQESDREVGNFPAPYGVQCIARRTCNRYDPNRRGRTEPAVRV